MARTAKEGNLAPDFTLDSTVGTRFKLKEHRGSNVVIYFYPKDNTSGCTKESLDFKKHYNQFGKLETIIVGISRDTLKSHQNFKAKHGFQFELLADPEEKVCTLYDVMKEKNMYGKKCFGIERSTFLINKDGRLVKEWRKVKVDGHVAEVLAEVKKL